MRIFFDVDTQNDFINSKGALSVPGAERIREKLKNLTAYAREKGIRVMGSVDRHYGDEAHKENEGELEKWGGPFPEHCMNGSKGQEKISETAPENALFLENREYSEEELNLLVKGKREVYFEKQSYNVFDNPNVGKLVKDVDEVVLYGVATDYCVLAAALGFRKLGKRVIVVSDGVSAVNAKQGDEERAVQKMKDSGVLFKSTSEIVG